MIDFPKWLILAGLAFVVLLHLGLTFVAFITAFAATQDAWIGFMVAGLGAFATAVYGFILWAFWERVK